MLGRNRREIRRIEKEAKPIEKYYKRLFAYTQVYIDHGHDPEEVVKTLNKYWIHFAKVMNKKKRWYKVDPRFYFEQIRKDMEIISTSKEPERTSLFNGKIIDTLRSRALK